MYGAAPEPKLPPPIRIRISLCLIRCQIPMNLAPTCSRKSIPTGLSPCSEFLREERPSPNYDP